VAHGGAGAPVADAKQAKAQGKAQAMQNLTAAITELGGGGVPIA